MNGDQAPVTWTVGTQRHVTRLDGAGNAMTGVDIPVTLSTGETFTVFVTDGQYRNTAEVKALIAAEVAHHAEVANLSGVVGQP